MKISDRAIEDGIVVGNTYDKFGSKTYSITIVYIIK